MNTDTMETYLIQSASSQHVPINGSLELLPLCNMNCDMCYVRLSREEMERQGRLRTVEEWLKVANEMQEAGTLFLILTGGEPLLYPGFRELYLELRKLGMIITINTNGTLIDEDWADFFAKHPPRRINITLYGTNPETYRELCHYEAGYEKALRGIRLLRERNVDVKINGSLVRDNEMDVRTMIETARNLDAAVNIDTYMYPAVRERSKLFHEQSRLLPERAAHGRVECLRAERDPETFLQVARSVVQKAEQTAEGEAVPGTMRCQAGRTSFTINWQGKMRPCVMLTWPEAEVFETGFAKAWEKLQAGVRTITLSSKCSKCRLRELCDTCAACALYEGGAHDAVPEYMCRYTENFVEEMRKICTKNDAKDGN